MSQKLTPNVTSTEEIVQVSTITNNDSMLVAMPVISDIGPLEPTIATNSVVVNNYMSDDLKRSDNISLSLAYALSQKTNLLLCRVSNTTLCSAVNGEGKKI